MAQISNFSILDQGTGTHRTQDLETKKELRATVNRYIYKVNRYKASKTLVGVEAGIDYSNGRFLKHICEYMKRC